MTLAGPREGHLTETVTKSPDGLEQIIARVRLQGCPQPADMDIHRALPDTAPPPPDLLEQVAPGEDPPGVLHEVGHQPELDRRQADFPNADRDFVAELVEPDRSDFEDVFPRRRRRPTQGGVNASQQLLLAYRLREVVIDATVKSLRHGGGIQSTAQHQNPGEPTVGMFPDVVGELEPGHVPKHPFRYDHVEGALLDTFYRSRGIAGADDLVAASFKAVTNPVPVVRVAVDEKNAGHDQEQVAVIGTLNGVPG